MKKFSRVLILLLALILTLTACTEDRSNAKQNEQETQKVQAKSKEANSKQDKSEQEPYYKLSKEQQQKVHLVVKIIREDVDSGEKYVTRIEKYDKYDRLLNEIDKNEKGEVTSYERYKYGDNDKLLEETRSRSMLGGGIMGITKDYSYNDQSKKTGYIAKNEWGVKCGKGIYNYYENGNLKYKYTNDQYRSREKKFYYNKKGEKTKVIDDVDGIFELHAVSHFKREYDEQGRLIKETEIRNIDGQFGKKKAEITTYYNRFGESKEYIERINGKIDTWFQREYDENGNEIKFVSRDSNGTIKRIRKNKYDKNGNKIEDFRRARKDNGEFWITFWIESKYNEKGRLVKDIFKNKNGESGVIMHFNYQKLKSEGEI
ncbi:hypothetical protein [Selenihalanaerobacter shriftii]|uniref:YD repeat-containing protein n=1 Tax=Selenihalanaerobacter shriftii TaxID=142842 RepID=A0A1T4M6X1_9FIRM|nr:hypothetical protein [Selenihalanaerobacter shriftii]SJZ62655.1 hypothetical protein SAMN02745118_01362 [Selenihalanaerobacter shriftii]